jgi:hypothetical protein
MKLLWAREEYVTRSRKDRRGVARFKAVSGS